MLTTVAVIASTAAIQSGCGSSQQPAGSKTTRSASGTGQLIDPPGGELSRPLTWQATFTGAGANDVTEVRFLIDGNVRHAELKAPYVFAGDGNQLLPGTLKPGTHTFAIDADLADGKRLTTASTATVAPDAPGIHQLSSAAGSAKSQQPTSDEPKASAGPRTARHCRPEPGPSKSEQTGSPATPTPPAWATTRRSDRSTLRRPAGSSSAT